MKGENKALLFSFSKKNVSEIYIYIYYIISISLQNMLPWGFLEVAIESRPECDLNPRPLNSV